MNPSIIAERQAATQASYLELMGGYTSRPFAARHTSAGIEGHLEHLECEMLDLPPLYQAADGEWKVRAKGLLRQDVLIESGELPKVEAMSFADTGFKLIPDREWSDIIEDPNRTPPAFYFDFEVDQDGFGSCAGEGAATAGTQRRIADGQELTLLNGYWNYHFSSGGVDRGSSLSENISVMQRWGTCSVDVRPRSRGWRAKPTAAEYENAAKHKLMPDGIVRVKNRPEFGTMILKGFCIYFGYPGHAITAVDVLSTTKLDYQNSWSRNWGRRGRGSLPFTRIEWGYGAFAYVSMGDRRAA